MKPYKVTVVFDVRSTFEDKSDNSRLFLCNFIRVNEYQHLVFHTTNGKKYTIRDWVSFVVEED